MDNAAKQAMLLFHEAVAAVQPSRFMNEQMAWVNGELVIGGRVAGFIPGTSRIYVIGAGKASADMALGAEKILGEQLTAGFVITSRNSTAALQKIQQITAGHPVPDANSLLASATLLEMAKGVREEDIVIFLLSGGASALMADVPAGSTLEEVQRLFEKLLKSGADIREMNTVRKHLSGIKGGQLAAAFFPAALYTIILSDVPGNDPAVIGSGPTVADASTFADAWAVLEKYTLLPQLPEGLLHHLEQGLAGAIPETPKPNSPSLRNTHYTVAANNQTALEAARTKAESLGYHTQILTNTAIGEARELGQSLARRALGWSGPYPACLLSGGETTVTVRGAGLGGRNQELALAAGILLKDAPHITLLAAGTDGIDGPTDAAGAFVNAEVMRKGPDPLPFLENNDAYHFFEKAGALIKTGPTHTNVMDVIIVLIEKPTIFFNRLDIYRS